MSQGRKQLLEFAPLVIFFIANWQAGIFWATAVFMAATLIVLAITYFTTGKVARVPLAGAVLVAVFGGLTLYLQDDTFIKIKVTLINLLFAGLLLGGLYFGKTFLKDVMGEAVSLIYWHLAGGYEKGAAFALFKGDTAKLTDAVIQARERLETLIDDYDRAEQCYLAQPDLAWAPRFSDHAQLARVAEWALSVDEEDA